MYIPLSFAGVGTLQFNYLTLTLCCMQAAIGTATWQEMLSNIVHCSW